ncbi:DUF6233 domain-containing protein [Streptomyces sp. NPDC002138]|uniref:DUF6233 domain-containing protein n=1 Tax=Streptomyces sp. NPDC002138 TaxID=3154410 RepID=UPI00332489D0
MAPPPEWELETDLGRRPVRVHVGGCSMRGTGPRRPPLTRDAALRALGVDRVEACIHFPIESSCCSLFCCARRDAC